MITQQIKEKASKLYDDGKWIQLAMLIIEFGIQLIKYLRDHKKLKEDAKSNNTGPSAADDKGRNNCKNPEGVSKICDTEDADCRYSRLL